MKRARRQRDPERAEIMLSLLRKANTGPHERGDVLVLADALHEAGFPKLARDWIELLDDADPHFGSALQPDAWNKRWQKIRERVRRAVESVRRSEPSSYHSDAESRLVIAEGVAKMVKRWSPSGRRLQGGELDKWREQSLWSQLTKQGLERYLPDVRAIVVRSESQLMRENETRRFARAYGRR